MATITSLTSGNSYGINSKGIGGLASGLDTDAIMKGMTLGTRTKIAKQLQSKQLLSWQTDAYRSVSSKLISFSKKYTSYTSSTNLSSPSFYLQNEITTAGSNSAKISVSGTSSMADQLSILSATQATTGSLVAGGPSLPDKLTASGDVTPADFKLLEGKSISLSCNGSVKTISFSAADAAALDATKDIADLQSMLQTKIETAFGAGKITVANDGTKLSFTSASTTDVLKITAIDDITNGITGLSAGDSNRLSLNKKLSELGISDIKDFKLTSGIDVVDIGATLKDDATISDLIYAVSKSGKNITMSYVESLNKFQFTSANTEKVELSGKLAEGLFGAPVGGKIDIPASTEAELQFKYANDPLTTITLKSSTNTFSLDGLNIKVNESFSSGDAVTLSSKADTAKVFTSIKDMVKDYNDMVDLVNSELSTKRNRNYAPLTDEQREDMSESEIKVWEEKAKTGMLFGNSDMSALSGELRTVFFSSGSSMANLQSIGISTSNDWRDNGKIIINEEKLKAAIDSDSKKIQSIFTDKLADKIDTSGKTVPDTTSGGVMSRLQNLMEKYSKTEGSTKGILIEKAGNTSAPLSLIKNGLLDKMNNIDAIVKNLKRTLTAEQKRYQAQFTTLERVISQLNSQSSWLSQQ